MQQLLQRASFNGQYAASPWRSLSGFGDTASDVQRGVSTTTPIVSAILASHAAAIGPIFGMAASTAVPIIGAALVAATTLVLALIKNSGCGQTCVVTSQWANQAADALQQNSDAYFALPVRTKAAQAVALANFDAIWAALKEQCSNPATGDAGKRCISDRERGACVWKQNRSGGHPGEPAIGQCWNWFNGYRDPIANDAGVVDTPIAQDAASVVAAADDFAGQLVGQVQGAAANLAAVSPLLLVGGALLAFSFLGGKD